MSGSVFFVNKNASDKKLSQSEEREDFAIRQFIQKRNHVVRAQKRSAGARVRCLRRLEMKMDADDVDQGLETADETSWQHQMSDNQSWSLAERRGVHYFSNVIAPSFLGSPGCAAFWSTWLARMMREEEVLRLMVSALALLHQTYNATSIDRFRAEAGVRAGTVVYGRGLQLTRATAANLSTLILSMVNILIVSIERLQGNALGAKACFDASRAIVRKAPSALIEPSSYHSNDVLDPTSAQWAVQAAQGRMLAAFGIFTLDDTRDDSRATSPGALLMPRASPYADSIVDVNAFGERIHSVVLRSIQGVTTPNHQLLEPEETREMLASFHSRLGRLKSSAQCAEQRVNIECRTQIAEIKVLEVEVVYNCVVLGNDELSFDAWMEHMERIVDCTQLDLQRRMKEPQCLRYNPFATLFIPSLWLVAARCRLPGIRRRAIEMLRVYRRREGFFDSGIASQVAERIMQLEEQGTDREIVSSQQIPRERRVKLVDIVYDEDTKQIQLSLKRHDTGDADNTYLLHVTIPAVELLSIRGTLPPSSTATTCILRALLVHSTQS